MRTQGLRYQQQKTRADQILAWLKGWDDLRQPKADLVDWIGLKLSCRREKAKREIVAALRWHGAEVIGVEVQRSDGVRRALNLLARATTPTDMDAKTEAAWRNLAAGKVAGVTASPALNLAAAVQQQGEKTTAAAGAALADAFTAPLPKAPTSPALPRSAVVGYIDGREDTLVRRARSILDDVAEAVRHARADLDAGGDGMILVGALGQHTVFNLNQTIGELAGLRETRKLLRAMDSLS